MLPTLAFDKANHFVYGAVIAAPVAVVSPLAAAAVCAAFAIGKEIRDKVTGKGNPELMDAVVTMAGGATVLLPVFLRL